MRTNGKCRNSHAPSTRLSGILLSIKTQHYRRSRKTSLLFWWEAEGTNCPKLNVLLDGSRFGVSSLINIELLNNIHDDSCQITIYESKTKSTNGPRGPLNL